MSYEGQIAGIQAKLKPLFEPAIESIKKKKKEFESKWNGEDIIKEMAISIQSKVESYEDINSAKKDFTQAMDLYGLLFLKKNEPKKVTDSEIFDIYNKLEGHKYEKTDDERSIEFSARSINPEPEVSEEVNAKFREKALEYIKNKIEETALSYLFVVARQEFGAIPFNKEKQLRQIRAVYHMLAGDSVAMNKGDGKTSVVIPIFTIIKSLFTDVDPKTIDKPVPTLFLSGAENKTTSEIRENVNEYTKHVNVGIYGIKDLEDKKVLTWRTTQSALSPDYYKSTPKDPLLAKMSPPTPSMLWAKNLGANIGFIPHSQMVFETTGEYQEKIDQIPESQILYKKTGKYKKIAGKKLPVVEMQKELVDRKKVLEKINLAFENQQPTFVVDEAHLLRNPFTTETGRLNQEKIIIDLDQQEIRKGLCDYLTIRLFHNELLGEDITNYVQKEGADVTLTDNGMKRVSKLIRLWFNEIDELGQGKKETPGIVKKIKKIVDEEIKTNYEVNSRFSTKKLINYFKETIDSKIKNEDFDEVRKSYRSSKEHSYKYLFKSLADDRTVNLVNAYLRTIGSIKKGKNYTNPDLLRDYLRGINLPTHKYSTDINFFLNALDEKPYLSEKRNLDYEINFYTWLALVNRGNFIALSNDLFYTDPDTGERSKSTLGKMIETYANGKVVDLVPEKTGEGRFLFPQPVVLQGENFINKISSDLIDGKKPEMLVCWNELMAVELFEKFKNQGKSVVMISSDTDDVVADQYQNQFSNYGIDILITTGRKSFAADFKDSSGRFTDFRISVVNPETLFQVDQAFGRNRLPKHVEDFSIYFEKDDLLDLGLTVLKGRRDLPSFQEILGKGDPLYGELEELVNRNNLNESRPDRLKSIIIEVLRRSQNKEEQDWDTRIDHEVNFIQNIAPKIKQAKKSLFYAEISKKDSSINRLIDKQLKETTRKYHLSKAVANKLKAIAFNIALNSFAQVDEQAIMDYVYDGIFTGYNPNLGKDKIVFKDILVKQFEDRIKKEYDLIWKEDLAKKSFYIQQVLKNQIREELSSYAKLLKQLPQILKKQGLTTSQVKDFFFLFAPPLQSKDGILLPKKTAKPITAPHGQKLGIKIKNGKTIKYLSSQTGNSWTKVDDVQFEARLLVLNKLKSGFFKGKKFVDIYYQGEETTSMFLRVVLKK